MPCVQQLIKCAYAIKPEKIRSLIIQRADLSYRAKYLECLTIAVREISTQPKAMEYSPV